MWPKAYKDYQRDMPLIKNQVSPGQGIVGCEMHDINGWGNSWQGQIPSSSKDQPVQLNAEKHNTLKQ
jgi:hypothetical protein